MSAVQEISEIITRLESSDVSDYDEQAIRAALGQIATVQTWVDRRKIALTHRLSQLAAKSSSVNAQHVLATAGNISRFEAYREVQRASTLEHFPGSDASNRAPSSYFMARSQKTARPTSASRVTWLRSPSWRSSTAPVWLAPG